VTVKRWSWDFNGFTFYQCFLEWHHSVHATVWLNVVIFSAYVNYFEKKNNKSSLMRSPYCLRVHMCIPPTQAITFEFLTQPSWNLAWTSCYLRPSQWRTSQIHPISNINTAASPVLQPSSPSPGAPYSQWQGSGNNFTTVNSFNSCKVQVL
jgi:hypothetical protein